MADRETVTPDGKGREWSAAERAALAGVDDRGRIAPAALADAKADARRYPDLGAMLDAQPLRGRRG